MIDSSIIKVPINIIILNKKNVEHVTEAIKILTSDEKMKAITVNVI